MRRHFRCLFAVVALVSAACSDNQLSPDRASGPAIGPSFSVEPPAVCPTLEQSQKTVDTLLPQIFAGSGARASQLQQQHLQARSATTCSSKTKIVTLIDYTL
jgi:hypothetical protein